MLHKYVGIDMKKEIGKMSYFKEKIVDIGENQIMCFLSKTIVFLGEYMMDIEKIENKLESVDILLIEKNIVACKILFLELLRKQRSKKKRLFWENRGYSRIIE